MCYGNAQEEIRWGENNSFTILENTIFSGENYMYNNKDYTTNSNIKSISRLLAETANGSVTIHTISTYQPETPTVLGAPVSKPYFTIILKPLTAGADEFLIAIRGEFMTLDPYTITGTSTPETTYQIVAYKNGVIIDKVTGLTITDIANANLKIEKSSGTAINFLHNDSVFASETITLPSDFNLEISGTTYQNTGFKYESNGFTFSPTYYPCLTGRTDEDKNWISNCTYDKTGALRATGIAYADELGRTVQSQGLDMTTGKNWISEVHYDARGRAALQTSNAPKNFSSIKYTYAVNFMKKADGSNYSNADWENTTPEPVGNTSESLGWYYSDANTSEPLQDITAYPFTKTTYSELNPGSALKVEGGRQLDNNLPQGFSYTVPAAQELYYVFGKNAFDGNEETLGKEVILKAYKTIVIDEKGEENVLFTDADGKTLAAARSGGTISYEVISLIGAQGYVDVHIPKNITSSEISFVNSSIGDYTIYNLRTEQVVTSMTGGNFYRLELSPQTEESVYITTAGSVTTTTTAKGIQYPVNYYDYTLNYYNDASLLTKSTQPLGFNESCLASIQENPIHTLATTYSYNSLGQLTTSTSPDEGTATFKYRSDGQIRYSQNSKQVLANEFSYTNYDNLGRPTESGVMEGVDFTALNPNADLPSGTKKEQHNTQYDYVTLSELSGLHADYQLPKFLAGNVAKTENDQTTTYYSYDGYGRVAWIVQNIIGLGIKTIDYEYDEVTSAVAKVIYQKHTPSELFIHRYTYDPVDNSLVKVETSTDDSTYTEHARYNYYETGALKNMILAEGLQQTDYVYTVSGQLKAINHPNLTPASDPGGNDNDMFGMTIDYFSDDYKRSTAFSPLTGGTDQHNGNIKGITWNTDSSTSTGKVQYTYDYNRENWLTEANFSGEGSTSTVIADITISTVADPDQVVRASSSVTFDLGAEVEAITGKEFIAEIGEATESGATDYRVSNITYDANGNIQTLTRNKNTVSGSNAMDALSYEYDPLKPNQLKRVQDAVTEATGVNDIKTQADANNYVYNEIGQLIENKEEDIAYVYNATGLVTEVNKASDGSPIVKFYYNDKNHRVKKESFPASGMVTTYYVRDVAGTPMAIYEDTSLKEHTIYGSGRVGVHYRESNTNSYQLTDHLGNVRAVIIKNETGAVALSAKTDYYPFGMPMPDRTINDGYRYAFQGQEKDTETGMEAFELRLWDARIGRWLTVDPYGQYNSPYLGMGNNPINGVDPDGGFFWDPKVNDDGSISYIAAEGDTVDSFAEQYGVERELALQLIGSEKVIAGKTIVSGDDVYSLNPYNLKNRSPILKLDLTSKNGRKDQNRFDQVLLAIDYERSIGNWQFRPRNYFSNRTNGLSSGWGGLDSMEGDAKLDGMDVHFKFSIKLIANDKSHTIATYTLRDQNTAGGTYFPNEQMETYFSNLREGEPYHSNSSIFFRQSDRFKIHQRFEKVFKKYHYINIQPKIKG